MFLNQSKISVIFSFSQYEYFLYSIPCEVIVLFIWACNVKMWYMSMGRNYVSELRLPTGLLYYIPYVIYEY
jgi:hypothetical protein